MQNKEDLFNYTVSAKILPIQPPSFLFKPWLPDSIKHSFDVEKFKKDICKRIQKIHKNAITLADLRKLNPYTSYHLHELGNISLLCVWYGNDMKLIAQEWIATKLNHHKATSYKLNFNEVEIANEFRRIAYYLFSLALRNSSERDVRELAAISFEMFAFESFYISFEQGTKDAFKSFERWGCQIARYRKPLDLMVLKKRYFNAGFDTSSEIPLMDEIAYGEQCYQDAEKALELCIDKSVSPKNKELDFLETKPERQGMRIAIEYMMEQHSFRAEKRGTDIESAWAMRTVRSSTPCLTPLSGYQWANRLTHEMTELAKHSTVKDIRPIKERLRPDRLGKGAGYQCTYKYNHHKYILHSYHKTYSKWHSYFQAFEKMERIEKLTYEPHWGHGLVLLEDLWPRLEELHHYVMWVDLNATDLESLLAFYDQVIEAIWLLGNLTPTHRGTGKLVEGYLTIAHSKHSLRTPILKFEYPQLDVLNLTFPLSIFKQKFFDFFEPESLPAPIAQMLNEKRQNYDIESLSSNSL